MEKGKKRYVVIGGVVILFMIIAGYGFVSAWGPCGGGDKGFKHDLHKRVFHSDSHGRDFVEFFIWRLDKRVKELNLTDAQQEKYNKIRSMIETHMTEGIVERKKMMEEIHGEILKEDPDVRFITESLKNKVNEVSGFIEDTLDLITDFYKTLDMDQRDKILAPMRERIGYHHS